MSCDTCGRNLELSFHHLIPRTVHTNKWFQKNFSYEHMQQTGINVCRDCHHAIHEFYPEKQLGKDFNTLDKILADEKLHSSFRFFSKQRKVCV